MKKRKLTKSDFWDRFAVIKVAFSRSRYIGRAGRTPQKFSILTQANTTPTLLKHVSSHPNARPAESSPFGGHFYTPEKTELYPSIQFGPFTLLTNEDYTKHEPEKEDMLSTYAQSIRPLLKASGDKTMEITFTWKDILRVKRFKRKHNGRRKTDQPTAIVGTIIEEDDEGRKIERKISKRKVSANRIAQKLMLTKKTGKTHEWTHIVGYGFFGEDLQIPKNLLLATVTCNTLMMLFEDKIRKLLKLLHDEFHTEHEVSVTLKAVGETYEDTHIGTCIKYHILIHVGDICVLNLKVKFDPQLELQGKPTRTLDRYAAALFNYALERRGKLVCFDSPSPQKTSSQENTEVKPTQLMF